MTAGTYDLVVEQGSTFNRTVTVQENSVAKDLSGFIARAQIRKTYKSVAVLATIGVTITDAANGVVTLIMTAAVTAALKTGNAVWDMEIDDQNATPLVTRILEGKVRITSEVTR
jgi:4-hydroxybenzoate polyprenyltransferase